MPLVSTDHNLADFFTKVLPPRKFIPLRNAIMNIQCASSEDSDTDESIITLSLSLLVPSFAVPLVFQTLVSGGVLNFMV